MLVFLCGVPEAASVGCHLCNGFYSACTGPDTCIFNTVPAENAKIVSTRSVAKTPEITMLIPPDLAACFSPSVVQACMGAFFAPVIGEEVDLTDTTKFKTASDVVGAFKRGWCTGE